MKESEIEKAVTIISNGLPAYDMFEVAEAKAVLSSLSSEKLSSLILSLQDSRIQSALIHIFLQSSCEDGVRFAQSIVCNDKHEPVFRSLVIQELCKLEIHSLSISFLDQMITLIWEMHRVSDYDNELLRSLLKLVERFKKPILKNSFIVNTLESVARYCEPPISSFCIALLGYFGDIDSIERIAILPRSDKRDAEAFLLMVKDISLKPINISVIRPENFEFLIVSLFKNMGYVDVVKSRHTHDGGIDIEAFTSDKRELSYVQCKRYSEKKSVRKKELEDFDVSVYKRHLEHQGVQATAFFVTTSTRISNDAQDYLASRKSEWELRLIKGVELEEMLDKYLEKGKYRIERQSSNSSVNFELFE